jgi:hypothetical protein
MTREVPEHHKAIAKHIASIWKGKAEVKVWHVEQGSEAAIPIVSVTGWPVSEAIAHSTIGVSDQLGFEIASVSAKKNMSFLKAFYDVISVMVDGRECKPGEVFQKVLNRYYTRANVGHLLLSEMAIPKLEIAELKVGKKTMRWLYAWPITSDELIALESENYATFAKRLRHPKNMDLLDLDRGPMDGVQRITILW